jgi:glucosyl-3-phosphoglycerate synthase
LLLTLHRLNRNDVSSLQDELLRFSESTPIGLVLPALYSELREVSYLRHIVVALAKATWKQNQHVKALLGDFPQPVTVLWIDGERIRHLFRLLEKQGLSAGEDGKGRSCWLAYGYLLALGDCDVITCMIVTSSTTTGNCWRDSGIQWPIRTWVSSFAKVTMRVLLRGCTAA